MDEMTAIPSPTKHTHKPNFGRYVADCPRCVEQHPDGPPQRKPRAAAETPSGSEFAELIRLLTSDKLKQLEKEAREEKRRKQTQSEDLVIAREQEAQRLAQQAACGHVKENGRSTRVGQVHNDGLFHSFCQRCGHPWPAVRPTGDQLPSGVMVI